MTNRRAFLGALLGGLVMAPLARSRRTGIPHFLLIPRYVNADGYTVSDMVECGLVERECVRLHGPVVVVTPEDERLFARKMAGPFRDGLLSIKGANTNACELRRPRLL
jgi:hypothetical protein